MRTFLVWTLRVTISPWKSLPDFLKEPMLAMSLLLCCFEPATTAASMAIGKPKAIDDAPAGRGPHRACAMGWPQGRSEAEDGVGKTFLPREEWAKPRGRKSIRPPLRLRRSRRSGPSARSSHGEAVWSARQTAPSGEDVADTERPTQDPRPSRRRKGNSRVQKGHRHDPAICADGDAADENCHIRPGGDDQPVRSNEDLGASGHADEPHSPRQNSTSSAMMTAQPHPSRVASAIGNDAGPSAPRRQTCGGTNSDMRAHAVPPTRTAPTIAKASRQPSDGTPIWASPNVAW